MGFRLPWSGRHQRPAHMGMIEIQQRPFNSWLTRKQREWDGDRTQGLAAVLRGPSLGAYFCELVSTF